MNGLLLLSGGFDSVVAGFLMKERGVKLKAIHFSHEPITDNKAEIKSRELAKLLGIEKVFVIKAGNAFAELTRNCDHRLYFILSKRLMYKVSERLARQENCEVLITGENLGQVSSQILSNLENIDAAIEMQVLRPLLCFDKVEIINLAKKIGSYDISCGPEVCDILGPKHPATSSKREQVEGEEKKLDVSTLVEGLVQGAI